MTAPRSARPATVGAPPWGILQNKKDAKLAGGHIARGATVELACRSRYNTDAGETMLGLGYVEAVLAVLYGVVGMITFDDGGRLGRVTMRSSGGPTAYRFAWKLADDRVLIGGFDHSDGQATYQAAVVALCQLVVQHRLSPSVQTRELVSRWHALVAAMEAAHPRANHDAGWSRVDIGAACANTAFRTHVARVCDSLAFAMRYHLPELSDGADVPPLVERGVLVQSADPLAPAEGSGTPLPGATLIHPDPSAVPVSPPSPILATELAPEPAPASALAPVSAPEPTLTPEPAPRTRRRAAAPAVTPDINPPDHPTPPLTPARVPPTPFRGGNAARVERALENARGPLFLVGPTATGKTSLAVRAAEVLGMGIELFACDPGMDAQEPFGGYARRTGSARPADAAPPVAIESDLETTATDGALARLPAWAEALFGRVTAIASDSRRLLRTAEARIAELDTRAAGAQSDWEAIDGPITRWARRAIGGERVLLIIDELARAHESCVSAVMRVLNIYDRQTITQQGLAIPGGSAGEDTFHIVDVWMTRERLVVPASRVKLIATANLGDRYLGLDLSDPAFRRRWTGGWLHLASYDAATAAQILSDRLGLPVTAALIAKLTAVSTLVEQEQRAEDKLLSTLDLATLLTWGELVLALHAGGMAARQAFETAALDVWVERICPLRGAEIDLDVKTRLLGFVTANAPTAIR